MTIVTTDNESAGDTFCSSQLYVDWFDWYCSDSVHFHYALAAPVFCSLP